MIKKPIHQCISCIDIEGFPNPSEEILKRFEKLGYDLDYIDTNTIEFVNWYCEETPEKEIIKEAFGSITFDLDSKVYSLYDHPESERHFNYILGLQLHQAISDLMVELGWFK